MEFIFSLTSKEPFETAWTLQIREFEEIKSVIFF